MRVPQLDGYNMSIAMFETSCDNSSSDVMKNVYGENVQLQAVFNIQTFCKLDSDSLATIFKKSEFDVFFGVTDFLLDRTLYKYAEFYERQFISPFGTGLNYPKQFSMGASFYQVAAAFQAVVNHFKWQRSLIIAESNSVRISFASKVYIKLTESGFITAMVILKEESVDEDIDKIFQNLKPEQKAIILIAGNTLISRIFKRSLKDNVYQRHAFFVIETNPYKPIDEFVSRYIENMTVVLDSILVLSPLYQSAWKKRRRRTTETNAEYFHPSVRFTRNAITNDSIQNSFMYDAFLLIDQVLLNSNVNNTKDIFYFTNNTYHLKSGDVFIDVNGCIAFDFILTDFNKTSSQFSTVQEIKQLAEGWDIKVVSKEIQWPNDIVLGPDDCFLDKSCKQSSSQDLGAFYILAIAIAVLILAGVATAIVIIVWRKLVNRDMSKGQHKILIGRDDLVFLRKKDISKGSKLLNGSIIERPELLKQTSERPANERSMWSLIDYSDITDTARYNGDLVHVKMIKCRNFELKNKVLQVMKALREIHHENVNCFIGFYDDPINPVIISDYCSRGSLEDVLQNQDIKLDWDFKVSLLTDLIRGVRYIHNSSIRWHGNLKCRNCLIDSRWVLKVADFGIPALYIAAKLTPEYIDADLLWMAPEHLKEPVPPLKGTEKGDVYSMSIIMQCVILRSRPYCTSGLTPSEIVHKLKHPPPLLRPSVSHGTAPPQYIQLMKMCWTENPEIRPSVEEIYQQYKLFSGGKKVNIVETMFKMLEKYSNDLENLVKDRTLQLEEEKKKTDLLLYRMLPPVVADSLKVGQPVRAETFAQVTIYFSDIVGFTTISANSTPMEVVSLLNDLYTMFDGTIDAYDVYKVETIGDAYMVCSGLPIRNENRHAGEISTMALDLLAQCGNFTIQHMPEVPLRVRIGLHSGPCVAGVVGLTMPRYCLFGDTVNTASRMESSGAAYRIHLSEEVKLILDELGGYRTEYRGEVELKGKGTAKTYWLIGKEGFKKQLPVPPPLSKISLDEFKSKSVQSQLSEPKHAGKQEQYKVSPAEAQLTHKKQNNKKQDVDSMSQDSLPNVVYPQNVALKEKQKNQQRSICHSAGKGNVECKTNLNRRCRDSEITQLIVKHGKPYDQHSKHKVKNQDGSNSNLQDTNDSAHITNKLKSLNKIHSHGEFACRGPRSTEITIKDTGSLLTTLNHTENGRCSYSSPESESERISRQKSNINLDNLCSSDKSEHHTSVLLPYLCNDFQSVDEIPHNDSFPSEPINPDLDENCIHRGANIMIQNIDAQTNSVTSAYVNINRGFEKKCVSNGIRQGKKILSNDFEGGGKAKDSKHIQESLV